MGAIVRSTAQARIQPVMHLLHLLSNEFFIMKAARQGRDSLTAREKMHRIRIGVRPAAEQRKLSSEPLPKEREEAACLAQRGMTELRELAAQSAHGAAESLDVRAIRNENINEAPDTICRLVTLNLPLSQHLACVGETSADDRVQDFILGLEVMVEITSRDIDGCRDVRKRCVLEALPIEQSISRRDDLLASCPVVHDDSPATGPVRFDKPA